MALCACTESLFPVRDLCFLRGMQQGEPIEEFVTLAEVSHSSREHSSLVVAKQENYG